MDGIICYDFSDKTPKLAGQLTIQSIISLLSLQNLQANIFLTGDSPMAFV